MRSPPAGASNHRSSPFGSDHAPFRNRKSGRTEWLNPAQLGERTVGFPKQIPLVQFSQDPVVQL